MGCGKTPAGGWHCEGTGCLDAGRVCMHDAAAPVGAVSLQLESADALFAPGGFVANPPPVQYPELGPWSAVQGLTVSREALGLEPSASYLLGEHVRRVRDALNDQESRLLERAFLPPELRRLEPGPTVADVSLPPAGELVQITTTDGEHVVGAMHNGLFFAAVGQGCWSPCFIASWCRVLVLPDSDEIERAVTAAVYEYVRTSDGPVTFTAAAEAACAAVRGAAVPRS